MSAKSIAQRTRFFLAVEGRGDQSFIKWLGMLSEQNGGHIALDCEPVNGGGYKSMLQKAIRLRRRRERSRAEACILMVDADRAASGNDGWTIGQLKIEAKKHGISVCAQSPNLEGLFLRMMPGNEQLQPSPTAAKRELLRAWPDYENPVDAATLSSKFNQSDLERVARHDPDLQSLLKTIGLIKL